MAVDQEPKVGDLRVWHRPQIPCKSFHVEVESPKEAVKIINTLELYDIFQFENRIKPDYCNASGLQVYEADDGDGVSGWCEWSDEQGLSIHQVEEADL